MNKKIIYGILALIVLVGAVLVVTIGLKLDMKNDANTKIYVYIGKEFDNNDIEQIAKETFETDTAIVQKVEIYNEMALITINIGVFNLLPIPALDGGRLFFLLIELVRRKPIKQKDESLVHAIGMVILLLFMAAITFKDIYSLIVK